MVEWVLGVDSCVSETLRFGRIALRGKIKTNHEINVQIVIAIGYAECFTAFA